MSKYILFFIGLFFIAQCSFADCIIAKTFPGTVRANVEKVAYANGWKKVVWQSQNNYKWDTATKITACSVKEIMARMLVGYPLQAVFYEGNHVLVIQSRTIK